MDYSERIEGTHFTWGEALQNGPEYAIPTDEQKANIIKQAHLLEKIRDMIGPMRVTSWLRTLGHHLEIYRLINEVRSKKGLSPVSVPKKSTHLVGAATDFVPLNMGVEVAKKLIRDSGIYPGGMEINTTTWVHCDFIHTKDFIA